MPGEGEKAQQRPAQQPLGRRADAATVDRHLRLRQMLVQQTGVGIGRAVEDGDAVTRRPCPQGGHDLTDHAPHLVVRVGGVQHPVPDRPLGCFLRCRVAGCAERAGVRSGVAGQPHDEVDVGRAGQGVEQAAFVDVEVLEEDGDDGAERLRRVALVVQPGGRRLDEVDGVEPALARGGRDRPMEAQHVVDEAAVPREMLEVDRRQVAELPVGAGDGADRAGVVADLLEEPGLLSQHAAHRGGQDGVGERSTPLRGERRPGEQLREPTHREDRQSGDTRALRAESPAQEPSSRHADLLGRDQERHRGERVVPLDRPDNVAHGLVRGAPVRRERRAGPHGDLPGASLAAT